jgi:hypothetical protein
MAGNYTQVRVRGLATYDSDLTQGQPDALRTCNNIVINRQNVAETRRGFQVYGNAMGTGGTVDIAKQLITYKNRVLRHYGPNNGTTLEYDDGTGTFSAFAGMYAEVEAGLRMRSVEANGNLYFTTSTGIKKISALTPSGISGFNTNPGYVTDAGGIKALDLNGNVDYTQTGWFLQDSTVAYRMVWGIKDANGNLVLGVPSARLVLYNPISTLVIENTNQLLYSLDVAAAANQYAAFSGTISGTSTTVSITANNPGPAGNSIALVFTGLNSVSSAILIWNTANPGNQATLTSGDGTQIPSAQTVTLANGSLSETDYLALLKLPANSSAATIYSDLVNLAAKLDADISGTSTAQDIALLVKAALDSTGSFTTPTPVAGVIQTTLNSPGTAAAPTSAVVNPAFQTSILTAGVSQITQITALDTNTYIFTVSSANATAGDTYSNNGQTFTVRTTIVAGSTLTCTGTGSPTSSGTLTKLAGSGDNSITFSSFTTGYNYASSGSADYFDIYSAGNSVIYRVYFQLGTATAPSSVGVSLVEIPLLGTETATQVASLLQAALNSTGAFSSLSPSGAILTVTNSVEGTTTSPANHVVNPGFLISVTNPGSNQVDQIICIPGNSFTLTGNADYFDIPDANNITYRIWFNAGTVKSPTNLTQTLVEVTVPGTTYQGIAAQFSLPGNPPTSTDLLNLQKFYDQIVTALIAEPSTHITATAQLAGNFQPSTQSAVTDLQFSIPTSVTLANFYQIYRTDQTIASGVEELSLLDPGDEEKLVYEDNPSAQDLLNGFIAYQDIVPDSFRGANLYTNPQSEEGILQANEVPPLSKDLCLFRNSVFYSNTSTKYTLNLSFLGITNLVPGVSTFSVVSGTSSSKYTFVSKQHK